MTQELPRSRVVALVLALRLAVPGLPLVAAIAALGGVDVAPGWGVMALAPLAAGTLVEASLREGRPGLAVGGGALGAILGSLGIAVGMALLPDASSPIPSLWVVAYAGGLGALTSARLYRAALPYVAPAWLLAGLGAAAAVMILLARPGGPETRAAWTLIAGGALAVVPPFVLSVLYSLLDRCVGDLHAPGPDVSAERSA